jgi:hypothetical protein
MIIHNYKKENPEGTGPIGILCGNLLLDFGNFAMRIYAHLPLTSELDALCVAYANPATYVAG